MGCSHITEVKVKFLCVPFFCYYNYPLVIVHYSSGGLNMCILMAVVMGFALFL